jgi:eukaryotic-like serine/threonine-protein kinase
VRVQPYLSLACGPSRITLPEESTLDRQRQEILIKAVGYGLLHREDLVALNASGASRLDVWDALSAFGLGSKERALLTGNLSSLQDSIFEERYVLLSELGRGGMGVVSRAFDTTLNRVVALKRLLPEAATSNAWDRFIREARSLARLDHPSCVRVYDYGVGKQSETPYMALQLVLGRSLRDRLSDPTPATWEEVVRWGQQLAEGLSACHAVGLVHRDIKPANILLERSSPSRALLADFGIAFAVGEGERLTKTGGFLGTYLFCAPETLDTRANAEPNPRSDLYSLGLSLYVALAQGHPYDAKSLPALLKRMEQPIPPLQEAAPDVPDWLAAALHRCLEPDPEDRFRDAADLAYALGAGQSGTYAVAEVLPPRTVPRRSRWPLVLGGVVLFGAGVLTGRALSTAPAPAPSVAMASATPVPASPGPSSSPGPSPPSPGPSPSRAPKAAPPPDSPGELTHLGGNEYRNDKDGSILIRIPGGTFQMGNASPTANTPEINEAPAHYRAVEAYYIGKLEITRGQWREFCLKTGRKAQLPGNSTSAGEGLPVSDDYPASGVGLQEAKDYCEWAGLRLPTEIEWEYAARGPRSFRYPWGNSWLVRGRRVANVMQALQPGEQRVLTQTGVSPVDPYPGLSPVGSFAEGASPFGCLDMCGNVYEWVSTPLEAYPSGKLLDEERAGSSLVRGGSAHASAWTGASTTRAVASPRPGTGTYGFRVARSSRRD